MSKSIYLLTSDLFDTIGQMENWDDGSSIPVLHQPIGFFEDLDLAREHYQMEISRLKSPVQYESWEEIQLKSLYPDVASDTDCCFHATGVEHVEYSNIYESTVTLVRIDLDDTFDASQESYLADFKDDIRIDDLGIPMVSSIFYDGDEDIPESAERVSLIKRKKMTEAEFEKEIAGLLLSEEDEEMEIDEDFGDLSDFTDDDGDPFDDNLPEPGTPLHNVMTENGILHTRERQIYSEYNSSNPGCSSGNPILIGETEDYVGLEYELLDYIMRPSPYRFVDYDVIRQDLIEEDGRMLDKLTVEVSKHPLLTLEQLSSGYVPKKEILGNEIYYFDITAGFNAMNTRK